MSTAAELLVSGSTISTGEAQDHLLNLGGGGGGGLILAGELETNIAAISSDSISLETADLSVSTTTESCLSSTITLTSIDASLCL